MSQSKPERVRNVRGFQLKWPPWIVGPLRGTQGGEASGDRGRFIQNEKPTQKDGKMYSVCFLTFMSNEYFRTIKYKLRSLFFSTLFKSWKAMYHQRSVFMLFTSWSIEPSVLDYGSFAWFICIMSSYELKSNFIILKFKK